MRERYKYIYIHITRYIHMYIDLDNYQYHAEAYSRYIFQLYQVRETIISLAARH